PIQQGDHAEQENRENQPFHRCYLVRAAGSNVYRDCTDQRIGDAASGSSPRAASSRFSSSIALVTVSEEFAFSIRRRRTRTAGSLSLIAHLRTKTCASKKE